MKLNLVVILGKPNCSGKTSRKFLRKLTSYNFNEFDIVHFKEISLFKNLFESFRTKYCKIAIFPIYREARESYLKKIYKGKNCDGIEIAKSVKEICKNYNNIMIFHDHEMGEIIGDKIKTNLFLSEKGIKCPKIIKDNEYKGKIFVNNIRDSAAKTKILNDGKKLSEKFYNTEFIDTIFEHNGEKYYSAPRLMCVGKEIAEIQIRLKNVKLNNPNVHARKTAVDPDLLNAYYDKIILPNIDSIKKICENLASILGFGFYNHDILICSNTKEIYVSETGYKFDNDLWKDKTNDVVHLLKSETNRQDTHLKTILIFEKEMNKIFK